MLLRLENLSDLFDGVPTSGPTFDIYSYAIELFKSNNQGQAPEAVDITERSLSNNQNYSTMIQTKFKWKSADGANPRLV